MNKPILLHTLWSARKSTFFWSLAMFIIAFVIVALFDAMASEYQDIVATIPPEFAAFVGDTAAAATPAGFLGLEMFGMVLPMALAVIGVGAGAGVIGREEESGTLELLLASPISRRQLMDQKAGAIAIQLALVSLSVWIAVALGQLIFPFDISLIHVAQALVSGWLLGLVFAFLTLFIQATSGSRSLALGVGAGVLLVTYFAYALAPMVKVIENIRYISPFHYYDGQQILTTGWEAFPLIVLVALCVIFFIAAQVRFSRRDIGV